jgi:hypothetical protein
MNKQQLFSALVGTTLALGTITIASAGNPTWRYDEESDSIIYASGGESDDPVHPQYGNQPGQYDADTGAGIPAFSAPEHRTDGNVENPVSRQSGIWPWNDPVLTDSWD